jgi:DNA-binding beta-propeller fold protein YncE
MKLQQLIFFLSSLLCLTILPGGSPYTASLALAAPAFTLFESGQVRPLALAPDGRWLFAVNTPDNRLEVFRITGHGLTHRTSVPVGLEPVAVAARSATEVWVVNHLSDSISVVALAPGGHTGRVVRTLLVGDEPRDIVFGGPGQRRAFITTAHRGQNVPHDPQLTTPGVGRADVWVFDAEHLGTSLEGDPLTIVTLFTDTPRALAVTPDGTRVYAAGFHTGNQTTSIAEILIPTASRPMVPLDPPRTLTVTQHPR